MCESDKAFSYFIIWNYLSDNESHLPFLATVRGLIIFHSSQNSLGETVTIKIGKVKQTKYVKFLGLLLDENLNWKCHLSELSKKLARTCGIFFKIGHLLPTDVLVSLYNSLFASFLQYGIIVWGLTYDTHIKPIYILQKKVVRAIAFMSFTSPSSPIFF